MNRQTIHMKCQDLFSLKNKDKNLECCLLQILLGALRVKPCETLVNISFSNPLVFVGQSILGGIFRELVKRNI